MTRALWGIAFLLAGCGSGERTFEQPVTIEGAEISADRMNLGEFVYVRYCRRCHGQHGAGDGPYASAMERPPADLTSGTYRHLEGDPPSSDAFRRVIREGVEGMPPQPVDGDELDAVVSYVRWLATADAQRVQ